MGREIEAVVPEVLLPVVEARLAKLNVKLVKLGLDAARLDVVGVSRHVHKDAERGLSHVMVMLDIVVDVPEMPLGDYRLLAAVDNVGVHGLLKTRDGEQEFLMDSLDLSECHHCKVKRLRKRGFVLRHWQTQETIVVGSSCVFEFLGVQPAGLLAYTSVLDGFLADMGEVFVPKGGKFSGSLAIADTYVVDDYLMAVWDTIKVYGWKSSKFKEESTAVVAFNSFLMSGSQHSGMTQDEVSQALSWIKAKFGGKTVGVAFELNLSKVAESEMVCDSTKGFWAYMFNEWMESLKADLPESQFLGLLKQRLLLKSVKVFPAVYQSEGQWGITWRQAMEDSQGNRLTWFTQNPLQDGVYDLKATVVGHTEVRGLKCTQINRVAVQEAA